ncbi:MAG: HipA N-terminal domain-containing protein [Saprospiraceae bacterium]|nr:HipA N-terminal domain-containing protein [Saprospiraceae bacterium]
MRSGKVYYKDLLAGTIIETNDGEYVFQYDEQYVNDHPQDFITFTMPVTKEPYTNNRLFSFFEGLIPEGWLLEIASKNWKINQDDRMGLLLACCKDCIGAVSVEPNQEGDGE